MGGGYVRVRALPVSGPLLHVAPGGAAPAHTARASPGHEASAVSPASHHACGAAEQGFRD